MSQVVGLPNNSYKPITNTAQPGFVNYKKGCTQLAAASDKVYQLLVHGRWFSLGTAASSNTKTGRHDIVEILLKVALNTKKSINQPKLNVIRVSPLILVTFVLLNILFSVQCFVDHWLSICLFLGSFFNFFYPSSIYGIRLPPFVSSNSSSSALLCFVFNFGMFGIENHRGRDVYKCTFGVEILDGLIPDQSQIS